jgi:hypothetical protein
MLSESTIDSLADVVTLRQEQLNQYVINIIAKRVKELGTLTPSDVYKLERLLKSGADVRKINAEIARITGLQIKDIKQIIKQVANDNYIGAKPYFDYRHKAYIAFEANTELQRVIDAVTRQTLESYENLSKAQAFMIRDLKNPSKLIPMPISKAYYSVIDEAVQASQQGVVDYSTMMRRTIQQLADSGIRHVEYNSETGKHFSQRLDTAVRRNILDGIRAINQGVQDIVGEQYGADGKEISVHQFSAPDHEPVQGRQFTNEEYEKLQNAMPFQDVNGKHYSAIERAIGTLNCRHFTYSIIIGVNKPNFTEAQLNAFTIKNNAGYTLPNGKHMTMYECTQKQREYELKIRQLRERQIALKTLGDIQGAKATDAKISRTIAEYKAFSTKCGLVVKLNKANVLGYKKIS